MRKDFTNLMMINLDIREISDLTDIEIRLSRSQTSYHKHANSTFFIDELCFGLFAQCFEQNVASDNVFNQWGPTKFRKHELVKVRQSLARVGQHFKECHSHNKMHELLEHYSLDPIIVFPEFEQNWQDIKQNLIETNRHLIQIIQRAIREGFVLWVLGL